MLHERMKSQHTKHENELALGERRWLDVSVELRFASEARSSVGNDYWDAAR
jgi:hypothetical protein